MPEENVELTDEKQDAPPEIRPPQRRYFTRRRLGISAGVLGILIIIGIFLSVVFYRYGIFDNYVKTQFTAKMADIGIVFDADIFRVTVNPLALELKNATFNDRVSGEKLFFIRDARLGLSVRDLYAWQLSRDISVDTTEINGAEVWVKFDENGKSNFSNLTLVEGEGQRVNIKYDSVNFTLRDGTVRVGDLSRKISGDARNVTFLLSPDNAAATDNVNAQDAQKRYKIDLTSTDSRFVYDNSELAPIDLRAIGIASGTGADITELTIKTPIGETRLSGRLDDWAALKYNLNIESTVDLTQTSNIFPLGATLRGVGNFKGKVTGEGETYRIEGNANSESLAADGVFLKGINVEATVAGVNTSYEANGKAVAELLTFEDFRVEFPQLIGNVRGTGTDFKWVGDLQAIAAKSGSVTLGGLFLSDATAELRDRELLASAGGGRAQKFSVGDTEFADLAARNLKFMSRNSGVYLNAPAATARSFKTAGIELNNLTSGNVKVTGANGRTDVNVSALRSQTAQAKNTRLKNVSADELNLTNRLGSTDITTRNLRAGEINANGVNIAGVDAPEVTLKDNTAETVIYSDKLRVAKLDAGSAVLGSLNIAGVRLTIRQGTIQGTSNDIDAGDVALKKSNALPDGGTLQAVKINKPVFIVEPSGRYRASADMTIGGGLLGSINLGAARADVNVNNERVALDNIVAEVMNGQATGQASIAFNNRTQSQINANFAGLDIAKLLGLQSGRIVPVEGETSGTVNLTFSGTNFRTASGTVKADIKANAGTADQEQIPLNGRVELTAANGLFNIDQARLQTGKSELNASGRFDLASNDSNLNLALNSTDASEIDRIVRVTEISPDFEQQLDSFKVQLAGNLNFTGKVTGNFSDPVVEGRASLDTLILRGQDVGSIASDIYYSPTGTELRNGRLLDRAGGTVDFTVNIPKFGENNTAVKATLTNINAGNLLAALPIDLPERIRDFTGQTSGTVDLTGLPKNSRGEINIASTKGTIAGQAFDSLNAKAVFSGTRIDLQSGEIRIGDGFVSAKGSYDQANQAFDVDLTGKSVPLPLALSFLPASDNIPAITGLTDFTAKAAGYADRSTTYYINFNGTARNVLVNENPLGEVAFNGNTANQKLTATLTATLDGRPQVINATLNFADENLPITAEQRFEQSPLAPFIAFIPQLKNLAVTGTATGNIRFSGNLTKLDDKGNRVFTAENLTGTAEFSQLALLIQDSPLNSVGPVSIRFSPREIVFESAHFAGGGSNITIAGTKAFADDVNNSLSIDGRINLSLLNTFLKDTDAFFSGFADTSILYAGPNATARLSGTANIDNGGVSTFIGSDRLTFDRIKTKIIFTANQAQIEEATGYLGGGKFTANGGALLEGLTLMAFRLSLDGNSVTVPLPKDFITTGDARLEIAGRRREQATPLFVSISGRIAAQRSLYSKDIELANIVGSRRDQSLSSGTSATRLRLDLTIEGRDALIVRNNIADLTASVSLQVTGDVDNPQISGRITANGGTILFRKDRYQIQRAVLEFPPDTSIEPIINLQAETEIAGYQIFVNLSGPLNDTASLNASVRSSPALPENDVVSLITTGSLSNTAGGIPTLAQTGINTAADILTDAIISNPARKATDKLFGLNVFEIDPIISGERINPTARLTVGRQINNNLRVTYATNLSQDQNQVLALEYRVSNKLSLIAQYEQRSLSNVTRNRDNFSIEVRFRRRF